MQHKLIFVKEEDIKNSGTELTKALDEGYEVLNIYPLGDGMLFLLRIAGENGFSSTSVLQ